MAKSIIRVGPAGWSYKDWEGVVYPQKPGKHFDPLEYLARFFNTIEINSSFYRPPAPSTTESWARRVENTKDFSFTAKLYRVFTHERGKATREVDEAVLVRNTQKRSRHGSMNSERAADVGFRRRILGSLHEATFAYRVRHDVHAA